MKTLETERLLLRDITFADAENLYDILSDEDTAYWFGMPAMTERWEAYRMIERGASYQWGITRKEDGRLIGLVQIYTTHWWSTNQHLGYVLSAEARGHHYMKEAVDAICNYVFEDTDADCITLDIREDNGPSRSVAADCGFFLDETLSDEDKDINFYGYPLDEFNRLRTTRATNRLGDFIPFRTKLKLHTCCAAA